MADEAQVLQEAAKLPLADQLAHSSWKVRAQALTTVQQKVTRAFTCEDDIFGEAGEEPPLVPPAPPPPPAASCRPRTQVPTPLLSPHRRPAAGQGCGGLQRQRYGQGRGDAGDLFGKG